jgi:hypothetical protein
MPSPLWRRFFFGRGTALNIDRHGLITSAAAALLLAAGLPLTAFAETTGLDAQRTMPACVTHSTKCH